MGTLRKRRYTHCQRYHAGQGLPGARRISFDAFRVLGPEEPDDWRCPMCDWGLPKGTRGNTSEETLAAAKEHHRKTKHRVPARVLNGRADVSARDLAARRAAGSARESCLALREAAAAWEEEAMLGLARIAEFYDSV